MPQQTGSARSYELLLIAVIAARATSFIFSKMILESLAPFNLLAVRFIIAFVLLALIFNKAVRSLAARDLLAGTVIGTAFFITMACEMIALTQAASSLVSLLENCAIIFVLLLEILLYKKLPGKLTVISHAWRCASGAGPGRVKRRLYLGTCSRPLLCGGNNCNGASFTRQHRHAWHRHSAGWHYGRAFVFGHAAYGNAAAAAVRLAMADACHAYNSMHRLWLYPAAHGAKPCQRRPCGIVLRCKPCHSRTFRRNCIRRTLRHV